MSKATLYILMIQEDGIWKPAHRIKRVHSIYSTPANNRVLAYKTYQKAAKSLEPTSNGNYMPEGTKIMKFTGELVDE